ncbi:hypothetical protein [Paenibacillus puerhi]|uniref:hypothetical protein n=1 Tax=Paenibacillus puerhi TaxID=2692622 RepID=UPI001357E8F5|nr:hypothetical protein [Paenibacillus puerhi]
MTVARKAYMLLLPGLATAPGFMDAIGGEMTERLSRLGVQTRVEPLFPYGDWSRPLIAQLAEIAYDLALSPSRYERSIGAARIRERLMDGVQERLGDREGSDPVEVLLLCHSGGGLAGLHAARWLHRREASVRIRCILVGAPKCRVTPEEREDVLVMEAARADRRLSFGDPVALLGSWGGWERPSGVRLRWSRDKHAPAARVELPIVGGHPDYFRGYAPFADTAGVTNLMKTAAGIELWLTGRWKAE